LRTIGLIGGMSWQSSRLYYDRINQMVAERRGGASSAKIILNSLDFAPIAKMQSEGQWREAGAHLANAAQALERAGADVIAIGANTMHKVANQVKASVGVPLLHIGDALVKELRGDGRSRPLLLGTRYTMEDPFLIDHLANKGIGAVTPDKADRDALHAIIYDELIKGIVTDTARTAVRAMIARSGTQEADSVIFGCTEIGMLFPPTEAGMPGYDTLEIHAAALVDFALGEASLPRG
jgi:aspartate racemase